MDVGIIGCGPMGIAMGNLSACLGHRVCFSFSRDPAKLAAAARGAGGDARAGTPLDAARFGQVVVLAVPWSLTEPLLSGVRPALEGKPVLTCVVPWNLNRSGLVLGTNTSAAEQIAALASASHVVEALPILADALTVPLIRFDSDLPAIFYCGNHVGAKVTVMELWEGAGIDQIDAGPLWSARFLEPTAALLWHMAVGLGAGTDIALKLLRHVP